MPGRLKIAYCCDQFLAPSETFIRDLSVGLMEAGNEISIIAKKVTSAGSDEAAAFTSINDLNSLQPTAPLKFASAFEVILTGKSLSSLIESKNNQKVSKKFNQAIRGIAPDVIYADYGTVGLQLVATARDLKLPLITHFHGYDLASALRSNSYRNGLSQLADPDTPVIVPSQHLRRLFTIATGKTDHVHVIPYEATFPEPELISSRPSGDTPTIVALGRLTGKKNPLALLEAFRLVHRHLPTVKLEWVGEGPERPNLERRIQQAGLVNSVRLHGEMAHRDAMRVMSKGSVFAQHSVTATTGDQEGLPVAILEAIAMNIPVVSTIHSGIPEVVKDGVNGFLVREHDYETMAERIIQILEKPDCLNPRTAFGEAVFSQPRKRVQSIESVLQSATGASVN